MNSQGHRLCIQLGRDFCCVIEITYASGDHAITYGTSVQAYNALAFDTCSARTRGSQMRATRGVRTWTRLMLQAQQQRWP